jgi:hypothetical protein
VVDDANHQDGKGDRPCQVTLQLTCGTEWLAGARDRGRHMSLSATSPSCPPRAHRTCSMSLRCWRLGPLPCNLPQDRRNFVWTCTYVLEIPFAIHDWGSSSQQDDSRHHGGFQCRSVVTSPLLPKRWERPTMPPPAPVIVDRWAGRAVRAHVLWPLPASGPRTSRRKAHGWQIADVGLLCNEVVTIMAYTLNRFPLVTECTFAYCQTKIACMPQLCHIQ